MATSSFLKVPVSSTTRLVKPKFHNLTSPRRPRQTRDIPVDLSATSPTPQCLVADGVDFLVSSTETDRLPTCHGNFSNHLNTSRPTRRFVVVDKTVTGKFPGSRRLVVGKSPTSVMSRESHGDVSGFQTITTCRDGLKNSHDRSATSLFASENGEISDVCDETWRSG